MRSHAKVCRPKPSTPERHYLLADQTEQESWSIAEGSLALYAGQDVLNASVVAALTMACVSEALLGPDAPAKSAPRAAAVKGA